MACVFYYDLSLPIFVFIIIGLIIGILIGIIIWFLYLRFCVKNQVSTNETQNDIVKEKFILGKNNTVVLNNHNIDKRKLLMSNFYNDEKDDDSNDIRRFICYDNFDLKKYINYEDNVAIFDVGDLPSSDVLIHQQDIKSYYELDFQYMNARVTGHMYLHKQLINLLFVNKLISKEEYNYHSQRLGDKYRKEVDQFNESCHEFITNIRKGYRPTSVNDREKDVETELQIMEQLPPKAGVMINKIIHSEQCHAREIIYNLEKNNQISKEDTNAILNMYSESAQLLENHLSKYKKETEIRNEKRWFGVNSSVKDIIIEESIDNARYKQREGILNNETLTKIGNLSPADRDQIMKEYREMVCHITIKYETELKQQKLILASSMREIRRKEIEKAFHSRNMELKKTSENSIKYSLEDYERFLGTYQQAEENIDNDILYTITKIDKMEIDEYRKLKERINQSVNTEINKVESELIGKSCSKSLLDSNATKRIMTDHQQNLYQIQMDLEEQKTRQFEKIDKLLNTNQEKNSDELTIAIEGQLKEEKKQETIFKMTINNQLTLPQDVKTRILEDIKADRITVNSQVQAAKVRQQKRLELTLAMRSKLKESAKPTTDESTDMKNSKTDLYEDLLKQMESEKLKVLLETRDTLVNETKVILKQRAEYVAAIMAIYLISYARKLKKEKDFGSLYQDLFSEMNNKMKKSLSAKQIIDQFVNEKNYIEKQKNSIMENQKEQLEKTLRERKEKVHNEIRSEFEKRYTDRLMELQKCGIRKEIIDFADKKFMDKISKSIEHIEQEVKQQLAEDAENWKDKIDETKFDKTINNRMIETLSRLVDISHMSKNELFDLINQISPCIDEDTRNQVVREIYRKQGQTSVDLPKYDRHRFDERDNHKVPEASKKTFNKSSNDYSDMDLNISQRNKPKSKKKRIKHVLFEEDKVESDF